MAAAEGQAVAEAQEDDAMGGASNVAGRRVLTRKRGQLPAHHRLRLVATVDSKADLRLAPMQRSILDKIRQGSGQVKNDVTAEGRSRVRDLHTRATKGKRTQLVNARRQKELDLTAARAAGGGPSEAEAERQGESTEDTLEVLDIDRPILAKKKRSKYGDLVCNEVRMSKLSVGAGAPSVEGKHQRKPVPIPIPGQRECPSSPRSGFVGWCDGPDPSPPLPCRPCIHSAGIRFYYHPLAKRSTAAEGRGR